ncbi:MAG: amidase [Deltaproteobacteria bacterium]|nr:MAG: amidase [Deltaproteobacteria bacterium]
MLLLALAGLVLPASGYARDGDEFELVEATIADIENGFRSGALTPEDLVRMYLARIAAYDQAGPRLNSFMYFNKELALAAARALNDDDAGDEERKPLFGVPVILKDNIATSDMPTTAGSIALGRSRPPKDAFIAAKLRRAGAILLGKGTLTEFANFIALTMPTGYSSQLRYQLFKSGGDLATAGYGFNPFDPRTDPRTGFNDGRPALATGGSSSGPGIAVSANLATVGVGTETSGSILSPSTQNLLVGIKPTVGLVSRTGIVPITADQDTAGPMARTVTDAAKLLGVLAGFDPNDPATAACLEPGKCFRDYTRFLKRHALRGARIAVPHFAYWTTASGRVSLSVEQQEVMNNAIAVLQAEGATVQVQEIPDQQELLKFGTCVSLADLAARKANPPVDCTTVLLFGFKRDLNAYLADFGPGVAVDDHHTVVRTLADVIAFNNSFKIAGVAVGLKYLQDIAIAADSLDTRPGSADTAQYQRDRAKDLDLSRARGLDVVFKDFDAVLFPANRGANIAARAGYPSIVVPAGFVPNPAVPPPPLSAPPPFPAGFNAKPAPYGVTFTGPAFSEPKLIGYAYAFEQATHHRVPPASTTPQPSDAGER